VFSDEAVGDPLVSLHHNLQSTGFALMPLLLMLKFPVPKWYVLGESTTVFSQLELVQYLGGNFDPREGWYLGGRVDSVAVREANGAFDAPGAAGGCALTESFLAGNAVSLAR
jgi:hypothetical protein